MPNVLKDQNSPSLNLNRRSLFRHGAAVAAALTLPNLMSRQAKALGPIASPYGAPVPTADQNTGLNLIQLPPGFKYWSFGWTGDPLFGSGNPLYDGLPTPALHDGMAVVRNYGPGLSHCLLIRNHEVGAGPAFAPGDIQYSPGAGGGNTNLVWNTKTKKLEKVWPSLSGTVRNCAGGVTPWDTWITGEETFSTTDGGNFKHGYQFEVPATGTSIHASQPIKAMGRFAHEACCVDPSTSIVYQTEDGPSAPGDIDSGFYRFVANELTGAGRPRWNRGGKLQMLKIKNDPKKDLTATAAPAGPFDTEWVDIDIPDPNPPTDPGCFTQGYNKGGARFRRLEGCWFGLGKVYFTATTGGPTTEGQVWEYDPVNEKLRLIYSSSGRAECENPDNLVVTPRGALILCEDNSGSTGPAGSPTNAGERLLGVTLAGDIFTFAMNNLDFRNDQTEPPPPPGVPNPNPAVLGNYTRPESGITFSTDSRQQEWAGACWNANGDWLFVNIQTPGITFAITGPWANGPF